MAPSKKKANGQPQKNRRIKPRYGQHHKRPNISRRLRIYKPSVREIVYALMNKHQHNQERKRSRAVRDDRYRGKMRKYRNTRDSSCDSPSFCSDSSSIEGSGYTKSVATSVENLSSVMEAANSSETSSTEDSSASNISVRPIALAKAINNTRALLKKKSLVQVINNYIKAGIEEGKRQAKKYLRKALSFGVKSGYLIPTDSEGQVIRVAPTLMDTKRSNAESRKRRRRARRGEDDPLIGVSKDRPSTPPWKIKNHEDTPKSQENPLQKRGKSSSLKKSPIRRKKIEKRSSRRSRRKMTRRKMNLLIDNFCNDKSEENLKNRRRRRSLSRHDDENRRNQRSRRSKSVCTKEKNENSRKNSKSFSDNEDISIINSHEVNERMSIGRLKSISKENVSRNCNVPSENPVEEIEEKIETLNEERNENDMI